MSLWRLLQYFLLSQMGGAEPALEQKEVENESMRRELEALKPELEIIKTEVHFTQTQPYQRNSSC